jgi:hypothetical protein
MLGVNRTYDGLMNSTRMTDVRRCPIRVAPPSELRQTGRRSFGRPSRHHFASQRMCANLTDAFALKQGQAGMEMISTILEQFGKPLSLITLCSLTFGLFVFIENMSGKQARADFARYLKSTDFAKAVVHLPNDTHVLFERVFGARHISWRCVKTSILFSVAAFAIIVVLNFLNDPTLWRSWTLITWEHGRVFFYLFVAYAIWSIVPDYFNLLKTRKVLGLITTRQINRPSALVAILFADFLIGYAIFTLSFLPMGGFFLAFLLGKADWNHIVSNFGFYPLPIFSGLEFPLEVLFWPGMVPSIWLWFYVVATVVVRLAVRSAPVFRFSIYFFDIDEHPIRSVGIVAAVLISCVYIVLLAIWKFADLLSEAT